MKKPPRKISSAPRCDVQIGDRYRHYKGGTYRIVAVGRFESTSEAMIAYQSDQKQLVWFRTLEDFTSQVGIDQLRFTRIDTVKVDQDDSDEEAGTREEEGGEAMKGHLFPDRSSMHRYMAPPESCEQCCGRGYYACGDEDDPRELYCECISGDERRRLDSETSIEGSTGNED